MVKIKLRADGWIVHEGKPVGGGALVFLPYKAELEEGYTLRSYFKMLVRYETLTQLSVFFPVLLKYYSECPENGCTTQDLNYLELIKTVEMIAFPGEATFVEIYPSLKGMSETKVHELKDYRLENLLDMPLGLGGLKHIVFGDKLDVFQFETVFNLFELIDGIAWELSFQAGETECQLRR